MVRTPLCQVKSYQRPPCQAPGLIGSTLGLVSPVSARCNWMRQQVSSAAFISEWQICLGRSVSEIHWRVAGALSKQPSPPPPPPPPAIGSVVVGKEAKETNVIPTCRRRGSRCCGSQLRTCNTSGSRSPFIDVEHLCHYYNRHIRS